MIRPILDKHLDLDSDVRGGRPYLVGTRIAVSDVVIMHLRLGQSLEEIASKYDLALSAVHAAMAYYYDHQSEVDAEIRGDEAFAEAFFRSNPSALQAKLKSLADG